MTLCIRRIISKIRLVINLTNIFCYSDWKKLVIVWLHLNLFLTVEWRNFTWHFFLRHMITDVLHNLLYQHALQHPWPIVVLTISVMGGVDLLLITIKFKQYTCCNARTGIMRFAIQSRLFQSGIQWASNYLHRYMLIFSDNR